MIELKTTWLSDFTNMPVRLLHDNESTYTSHIVRKPTLCICKNKDMDQLRGNHEADQRLCFAAWIVQFLYFLNPECPVSIHILCSGCQPSLVKNIGVYIGNFSRK